MAFDFDSAKPDTGFDFSTATPVQPVAKPAEPVGTMESIGRGMADPITGGAQLLTHVLPQGVVEAGNTLNNWLSKHGLPLEEIPKGGLDESIKQQETQYQAGRKAAGKTGIDWARLGGNVLSPAN